jgi:hypothetical protein
VILTLEELRAMSLWGLLRFLELWTKQTKCEVILTAREPEFFRLRVATPENSFLGEGPSLREAIEWFLVVACREMPIK